MKQIQFDAHNNEQIEVDIQDAGGYDYKIIGGGVYIIINPDSKFVSFSKAKHDICLGDVTKDVIPNYTNQDYANEYGSRLTGMGLTVKEYMQQNCRMRDIV